jgi:hypothetical protein
MELILGIPPMSQYDAAAAPMYNAMTATPDPKPFAHLPGRIALGSSIGRERATATTTMMFDASCSLGRDQNRQA